MVLLSFTNVVVDEFGYGKGTENKFIYFLTHWHSDHYTGISNTWKRGKIYCSQVTRNLMLSKYPTLQPLITGLDLDIAHTIQLSQTLNIKVHLFDSNHIAGSVMILFEGYFGRILHSGDMRFHSHMLSTHKYLFPSGDNQNQNCSLLIDELILDNTYCDPIFKFPLRSLAIEMVIQIIDKNPHKRVFIATDTIGKEEVFISLSRYYNTRILINLERYNYIKCMNVDLSMFCRKDDDCWIEVIKKRHKEGKLQRNPKSICITLTGWANVETYHEYNPSLHSNFVELDSFVKAVQPSIIRPIVKNKHKKPEKIYNIRGFSSYMNTGLHLYQRGLDFFQKEYTNKESHTEEYKELSGDSQLREHVLIQLGLKEQMGYAKEEDELIQEDLSVDA